MVKVLAVHGSPRLGGNSDLLLSAFIEGATSKGASVEKISLYQLKFSPCIECGGCDETGECVLKDDLTPIYEKILSSDVIVCATPIFFYAHPAMLQAFFERFQALWCRKYRLNAPHPLGKTPKGLLLAVGATKGKKLFEGLVRTFKYVMDACWGVYVGGLFFRGVDEKGAILKFPEYLEKVIDLGVAVSTHPEEEWQVERSATP